MAVPRQDEQTLQLSVQLVRNANGRSGMQVSAGANSHDAIWSEATLDQFQNIPFAVNPNSLYLKAQILSRQHKYTKALAAIKSVIQKNPDQARYFLMEGELYQRIGNQLAAIRSFLRAQQLDSRSPDPVYSIGMSFFILGYYSNDGKYYDLASHHFNLALQLAPHFSKAEFMLGVIDVVKFQFPEARLHFEKAIQLRPKNAYYHLHYGVLLNRLGDSSHALDEIQLAEKLDPNYALTHFSLGRLYSRLGRYREAQGELEKSVELDPHLANAFYSLGEVYHHLGQNVLSRKAYERFQSLTKQEKVQDPVEAAISSPSLPKTKSRP